MYGHVKMIGIIPPSEDATFDYSITDSDGFGISGATGQKGTTTSLEDTICYGTNTFTLANATDGVYSVRVSAIASS